VRKGKTIWLLSFRSSKDEVDFHETEFHEPMMELQVPGDTAKPLKEPDRELMSLVDAMLGQVSCSRIGPRSFLRFPFGLFSGSYCGRQET